MSDPRITEALRSKGTSYGSSRWAEYRRCQYAHHLSYTEGIRRLPIVREDETPPDASKPDGRSVGSLVHAVFEWVASTGETAWTAVLDQAEADGWRKIDLLEAKRILNAYFRRYEDVATAGFDPEHYRIVAVERELQTEIGGFPISGRADLVVIMGGQLVIVDHKTRSRSRNHDAARTLRTRDQFLALSRLVQIAWELPDPPHVMCNDLIRTQVPDFRRTMVEITKADMRAWVSNQVETARNGLDGRLRNYNSCAPDMPGSRKCDFFDYCHGGEGERETLYAKRPERQVA